jgi:hypothetical protein
MQFRYGYAMTIVTRWFRAASHKGLLVAALFVFCAPATAATWTPHTLSNPPGIGQLALFGVSCNVTTSCTTVGQDLNSIWGAHAESGAGGTWTFQAGVTRNPGQKNGILRGASCAAATSCMTVGSYGTSNGVPAMMAQQQSGSSWTLFNLGIPAAASRAELNGVSCPFTTWCMAVGYKLPVFSTNRPLAMVYTSSSSWSDAGAVSTSDAKLHDVSCTSSSSCVAVGFAGSAPIAQKWNGIGWTATAAPPVPGAYSIGTLASVSCVSANWCLATGSYKNSSGLWRPFADVWNGSSWSTTPAIPWGGNIESQAYGVSCISTSECWIVGEGHLGSSVTPWGVEWSGTTWYIGSPSLASGASGGALRSISCSAPQHCEAAGWSFFGSAYAGLVETVS